MRLFVGFFLPEHINDHLQMALESVNGAPGDADGRGRHPLRWVAPEDRHITLAFYGDVPSGAAEDLIADLQSALAAAPAMSLRLRGAGVFTGRTLWAGVQEKTLAVHSNGSNPLVDLMRTVQEIGVGYGRGSEPARPRERRRAHVTLARARERDRRRGEAQIRRRAEALAVYEGPAWVADAAHLVLSELGAGKSGAPQYSTLAALPLGLR
ncbi:RNA 2',3'-cyclic phosphodiesterase [Nesterenkonia muleiensis]|uniref:RNA 2',3'-cyclic phosphodiesterase n=1 Tax=Nesterenkonia muleiensis TaxID=2282648 RepID=UPI001300177B|nr:RNA 2',3'-cyclic phosphodiesterase [Nesterenkonia muleiensis]